MDITKKDEIKAKMLEMAKRMGMSDDTLKAMESDKMEASTPSVTVAIVKEEESDKKEGDIEKECANLTDDQISKMSDTEAKDYLKKIRDSYKEDAPKEEITPNPTSPADRMKSLSARSFM